MLIDSTELCRLIPHAGDMCLLAGVRAWDDNSIRCLATSHNDPRNPLRQADRLASLHLLEYGAQAMAVHGALLARRAGLQQGPGYLASLQDVSLAHEYLQPNIDTLEIQADKLVANDRCLKYHFVVEANHRILASAAATVYLHEAAKT